MKVLITGGVRSGKSRHAEALPSVSDVAPGRTAAEDHDWVARSAAHQDRRPATWTTVESRDLASAQRLDETVLVDWLGTWLTAVLDERELWEATPHEVAATVDVLLDPVVALLEDRDDVVLVTSEGGLGVAPAHRAGRLFRDLLGMVGQGVATACDEVHLVGGRVLRR